MKLYPAIDLIEGQCVRLSQGRFTEKTVYDKDPVSVARSFKQAGAQYLHVVDLDGARAGAPRQAKVIGEIVSGSGLEVQVGGGIRRLEDAMAVLEAGASRVVVGSLAAKDPKATRELLKEAGSHRVTLALDVKNEVVAVHGWEESGGSTLWEVLEQYADIENLSVLCTDVSRDGMLSGPNVSLYRAMRERFPKVLVQASGGIGMLEDLDCLKKADVDAAIVGRALYERRFRLEEALQC